MAAQEQYIFEVEHQPPIALEQLYGLDKAVLVAREIVAGCVHADFIKDCGTARSTGLFLYGGSGVGKSSLVRAMTNKMGTETGDGADLLTITAAKVYSQEYGTPEDTIARVFDQAVAYEGLSVLFFDEADGLLGRTTASGTETRVTSICKARLPKLTEANPRLVLAAATNSLQAIDPAVYGPHRFSYQIGLQKPKIAQQVEILQDLLQRERYDAFKIAAFKLDAIDPRSLVENCPQFNGGDLVEVVRRAKLEQILRVADTRSRPAQVTQADLFRVIESYRMESAS
jgi:SpoVK/Ycf46/Vps4 family AAA+-type ATPase